ncbi:MAG: V4R domain-containing protein [Longimicrobiales bacterium]
MGRPGSRPAELALPVASLAAIRHALTDEVGADAAARAMRAVGYAAGDALFTTLSQQLGPDPEASQTALGGLNAAAFWRRLSQLFSTRGWGALSHEAVHPGVGALETSSWVEAEPGTTTRPSCFFTTGLLANLLGHAAQSEIAVLEVECRSRGDARCRFLVGNPDTLEVLYGRLRTGESVAQSIESLV